MKSNRIINLIKVFFDIKRMKVYPETIRVKNTGDDLYNICIGVIWGSVCCILLMVLLVIVINLKIEELENDNSGSY
tara:strand:+ start:189 stop:416 length:228 start_codon:yes stop_codon:yes gene_type:complete